MPSWDLPAGEDGRWTRRIAVVCSLAFVGLLAVALAVGVTKAQAGEPRWPTPAAMNWQPPTGFLQQAFCIHNHESVDWYRAYVDWQGEPSSYSGGMQFTLSTWRRAGGAGHPHEWRPREQVFRAFVIWRRNGGSWREWGTAGRCV